MADQLVIYDGDCGLCRKWVNRWREWAPSGTEFRPSQEPGLLDSLPNVTREDCARAVVLVDRASGSKRVAAAAVFRLLAHRRGFGWLDSLYAHSKLFALLAESGYRFVAGHRVAFARADALVFGSDPALHGGDGYFWGRWAALRALGAASLVLPPEPRLLIPAALLLLNFFPRAAAALLAVFFFAEAHPAAELALTAAILAPPGLRPGLGQSRPAMAPLRWICVMLAAVLALDAQWAFAAAAILPVLPDRWFGRPPVLSADPAPFWERAATGAVMLAVLFRIGMRLRAIMP